ncbi:MAG TPA: hypothetical protein DIC42_01975 [Holosporales bacterium]|nr:hypothetical protein [Holosporales bacterium]
MGKEIIKPTYSIAFKVFITFFLYVMFIQLLLAGIIGFFCKFSSIFIQNTTFINNSIIRIPLICAGVLVYISIPVFAMYMVLEKKFKGFSLAIIKNITDKADTTESAK